mmetsp:Transcript_15062/g.33205  ORF Transcript_15062/g.33205 Transcript_15062/m.33205 type:complete len:155 (+) Transcript_15062:32-496(+)
MCELSARIWWGRRAIRWQEKGYELPVAHHRVAAGLVSDWVSSVHQDIPTFGGPDMRTLLEGDFSSSPPKDFDGHGQQLCLVTPFAAMVCCLFFLVYLCVASRCDLSPWNTAAGALRCCETLHSVLGFRLLGIATAARKIFQSASEGSSPGVQSL